MTMNFEPYKQKLSYSHYSHVLHDELPGTQVCEGVLVFPQVPNIDPRSQHSDHVSVQVTVVVMALENVKG